MIVREQVQRDKLDAEARGNGEFDEEEKEVKPADGEKVGKKHVS